MHTDQWFDIGGDGMVSMNNAYHIFISIVVASFSLVTFNVSLPPRWLKSLLSIFKMPQNE